MNKTLLTLLIALLFTISILQPSIQISNTQATSNDESPNNTENATNIPPTAVITASTTTAFPNTPITFNANHSTDTDGTIINYSWNFGDTTTNATGITTTHTYNTIRTYTVTLTVTDNQDAIGTATTTIHIATGNLPPTTPTITGPTVGTKNQPYTYTITATDTENDPLLYDITWGDNTFNTSTLLANNTPYTLNHTWTTPGIYHINATATDSQTISPTTTLTIYIDCIFLQDQGCLYDANNDGILDTFYHNTTHTTLTVNHTTTDIYTFTLPGNPPQAYLYNPQTRLFSLQPTIPAASFPWIILGAVIATAALLLIAYLIWRNKT